MLTAGSPESLARSHIKVPAALSAGIKKLWVAIPSLTGGFS
jgi:hypothetical protein